MNNRNTSCRAVCEENKKNAVMITTDLPAGPLRSGPARLSRAFSRRDGRTSTHTRTQTKTSKRIHCVCVYNTRRRTHTLTHTHIHTRENTHTRTRTRRRSNLLFFLNLWRKSTTPPASHIPWRFLLLYVMRINHDAIVDEWRAREFARLRVRDRGWICLKRS